MTKKNFSNSELFTIANQIRKETGCSRSEAYYKAKEKLENKSTFNLKDALSGMPVKTKSGKKVKIICETRGKILCHVYSNINTYLDRDIKYNLNGTRWSSKYSSEEDLVMA